MKIIVVEDNIDLLQEMMFMLQHCGHEVRGASSGVELDRQIAEAPVDAVLLDVGLSGEDGFSIAERLHRLQPPPGVIMLTARSSLQDRLHGLRSGADHYLVKPVDRDELLAVLDRLHHRLQTPTAPSQAPINATPGREGSTCSTWVLDSKRLLIASPQGATALLSARELSLLLALIEADGRPVPRHTLIRILERDDSEATQRALEVKLSRLRKKLREINAGDAPLRAEWGTGYVFAERCQLITK